jgi:hypothetical protein
MENIGGRGAARGAGDDAARSDDEGIARELTWMQAAQVLDITPRQLRRIRRRYERWGLSALMDQRADDRTANASSRKSWNC